jgi:hypothetical protein
LDCIVEDKLKGSGLTLSFDRKISWFQRA